MIRHLKIFSIYFQLVFQYRARSFLWFIVTFINPLVVLMFWGGIFAKTESVGQWNYEKINSYYLVFIMAGAFLMHHVEYLVANYDIKRGDLVRELLKPFPYLKSKFLFETPWRLVQGFYSIVVIYLLAWALNRTIVIFPSIEQLPYIILIIINAYMIAFFFKLIIGMTAFWLTNTDSVFEAADVAMILFTGVLIPLDLTPHILQVVAHLTPYPYILYYPVGAMIGIFETPMLYQIIFSQFAWLAGLFIFYKFMWSRGLKQYTGVGQ